MNKNLFYQQAELLISILPHMIKDTDFVLHGGTAINFFVRDMPRLSVDIDLTYLRISSRAETLGEISKKLKIISERIYSSLPSTQIEEKTEFKNSYITKLFVKRQNAIVKIEPNLVIRGSVFNCKKEISARKQRMFSRNS